MFELKQPTPQQVKDARINAKLTQDEAAALVHSTSRSWQNWEATGTEGRSINMAAWELFLIKTTQSATTPNLNLSDELKNEWHTNNKDNIEATKAELAALIKQKSKQNDYEWITIMTKGEFAENTVIAWAESNGIIAKKQILGLSSGIYLTWGKIPMIFGDWDVILTQDCRLINR